MKIMKVIYKRDGLIDEFNIDTPCNAVRLVSVYSEGIEEYDGSTYTIISAYWECEF